MAATTQRALHIDATDAPATSNGTAAPAFSLADLIAATVSIDATEVQSAIAGIKAPRGGAHAAVPITDTLYYQLVSHYYTSGQWGIRSPEEKRTTKTTDHGTVAGTGMVVTSTDVTFTGKVAPFLQIPWNNGAIASLPELQPRKSATDAAGDDDATTPDDGTDAPEDDDATDTDATTDGKKKREDRPHDRFYKRLREAGDAHTPRLYVAAVSDSQLVRGIKSGKLAPDCATFRVFDDSERPVMSDTMRKARETSREKRAAEKAASATRTADGPVPPDATDAPATT